MKYISKPKVIEAIEFDGTWESYAKILKFMDVSQLPVTLGKLNNMPKEVCIPTLEGNMIAGNGDYIIKGIKGEFYPCKPDVFNLSYEPLTEESIEANLDNLEFTKPNKPIPSIEGSQLPTLGFR